MAAGGEEGCRLVRDQRFIKELVDTMGSWIEAHDLAVPGLIDIAEGQPLRLRLIRAILQAADDPDRDFLLQAEIGLLVGILEPLPRTPHVFEPQEKWLLENTPWEPALAWVPNYGSTRDDLDFAKAKFEEEIEETSFPSSSTLPALITAFSKSWLRSHDQSSLSAKLLLSGGHLPGEQSPPPSWKSLGPPGRSQILGGPKPPNILSPSGWHIGKVSASSSAVSRGVLFSFLDWVSGTPSEAVVAENAQAESIKEAIHWHILAGHISVPEVLNGPCACLFLIDPIPLAMGSGPE